MVSPNCMIPGLDFEPTDKPGFSGTAYIGGKKITGLNSQPWKPYLTMKDGTLVEEKAKLILTDWQREGMFL